MMKNSIIFILTNIIIVSLIISCVDPSDLLDRENTGDLTIEQIYNDISTADQVLTDLYSRTPNIFNGNRNQCGKTVQSHMVDAYSIYGNTTLAFAPAYNFNLGNWSPSSGYTTSNNDRPELMGDFYRFNYAAIRACLHFLENIEQVPFNDEFGYSLEQQKQKIGEANFLLAFFYRDLMKNFGGVTIVKRSLTGSDPEVKGIRNTYDEVVHYIDSLCLAAAVNLPAFWPSNQEGRATEGAALALRAQNLLSAASPLFNDPSKPDDSPFRGAYDPGKWDAAARAATDVIELGRYSIPGNIATNFIEYSNSGVIYMRPNEPHWAWEQATLPRYVGGNGDNANRNQGTYSFMKYYKVVNGGVAYDQDDPASGWSLQDPYTDLDPRFYRDFIFNEQDIRKSGQEKIMQIYELGENTTSADAARHMGQNNTYLYNKKYCDLDINPLRQANGGRAEHNFRFLRYAEILLNYAEAVNEAYGPGMDPYSIGMTPEGAINEIRSQVKCENFPEYMGNTYSMPLLPNGLSQTELRKEIRQERHVELGFEDHLFYDIRRWKVPVESQLTTEILKPTLYRDTPGGARKFRYEIEERPRAFTEAWYILPIPQDEILINSDLIQNPGWPGSPE